MAAKKPASKKSAAPRAGMNYDRLVAAVATASEQTACRAAVAVNQWLVIRNWLVGAYLVEYEQNGSDRAKYGTKLLDRLAQDLSKVAVRGFTAAVLRSCRLAYHTYPQIRQTVSVELLEIMQFPKIRQTLSIESGWPHPESEIPGALSPELSPQIRQTVSDESASPVPVTPIRGTVTPELPTPLSPEVLLRFSWSKLQELIRIEDPWKRAFYENECLKANWSVRQLQRQIETLLYERTGLSTNKKAVIERARKQEPQETIEDLIRDPYVLEFAGLADRAEYSENDLETALLNHLQRFLLELGTGFCFEARQFRITTANKHHRVDLVFYHRRLRCHVLIDLKIRAFQPADAGQMNFYVNCFKETIMAEGDSPPVGIILCSGRDHTDVEFATAGMDAKLFVSRYLVALPSAEQLKALLEADRALIESARKAHR